MKTKPNILLISYYFPPCGAIGSRRWGSFFDLAQKDSNVSFTVLSANWKGEKRVEDCVHYLSKEQRYSPPASINREFSVVDTLLHPTIAMRSVDRTLFSTWLTEAKKWVDDNRDKKFDLIISSFGPVASVAVGTYAKKIFKAPLIVDLRDLISIQGQKKKIFGLDFFDKWFDKFITRKADAFLTVSKTGQKKAEKLYGKKVYTIYNGFDNYFSADETIQNGFLNKEDIKILYTGTLGKTRDPQSIIRIIDNYLLDQPNINIKLLFASQDNPFDFVDEKDIKRLSVEWLGYLSKEELSSKVEKSDAFLLLEDQGKEGNENLTGKVFEYLGHKKPILASCHKDSDIAELLNKTNAGLLVSSKDDFHTFLNSKSTWNNEEISFYSRKTQFERLMDVLKKYA